MVSFLGNILQLLGLYSRKIALAIGLVLVVLMSLSVANTLLIVLETMNLPGEKAALPSLAPGNAAKPDYQVSNLPLFGNQEAAGALPRVTNAPETRLNLELQGVFIASEERNSTAIICEKNQNGELYRINDLLPGNATLAAVHTDHVLIRRGSRMEKLLFPEAVSLSADPVPAPENTATNTTTMPPPGGTTVKPAPDRGVVKKQAPSRQVSQGRQSITQYRERLKSDPAGLLKEVGISPMTTGESQGFRVGAGAQDALKQAGLQSGDVIVSVNGQPANSATNDSAFIDRVLASSRVRVEVQRGQRRFFLTVPVPK